LLLLLPGVALQAGVADNYDLEALPSNGVASKVAVDMVLHGTLPTGLWFATGRGVNSTFDDGVSWLIYGAPTGLPSENVSALFSQEGRLWVATSHEDLIEGQLYSLSDGLSYTDDNGENWATLDFGSSGLNIARVIGGDRTIYDITGHHDVNFFNSGVTPKDADWLFAAAFAGGLLASQDGGTAWRRIFPSTSDSVQFQATDEAPSLRNRYFSCVVDTSHGDTLFLWAGTASGIFQYVFAPPRNKLYSRIVNCIALCDTCSEGDGGRIFFGGQNGVTLTGTVGGPVATRFESDGLPGQWVTSMYSLGDFLLVGTIDTAAGDVGFAISTDFGESFTASTISGVTGTSNEVAGFAHFNDRLYMSAQAAGLLVSADSGQSWDQVPLDTLFASPAMQSVYAVGVFDDTLCLGTDSGLVELTVDAGGVITDATHYPFADSDSLGARIIKVRPQIFVNDSSGLVDSTVLWTVHRPLTESGISMVGRRSMVVNGADSSYEWASLRRGTRTHDVNFFRDTAFTVGDLGIWFTTRGTEPTNPYSARQYVNDSVWVASLDSDTVTAMEVWGDSVVFATSNGFAICTDRGRVPVVTYRIVRANFDTLKADLVVNHTYLGSLGGLLGDFIPALAVQYLGGVPARIWAGCRPAESGQIGISVGVFNGLDGTLEWQPVYGDDFAWNFEFDGQITYAAANVGLLVNDGELEDVDTEWDTVSFVSDDGDVLLEPGTAAYGVRQNPPYLWVGSDDGTIRMDLADWGNPLLFQRVDSTTSRDEVYAFPVPFSPTRGQEVDFHFVVEQAGNVSVQIYDFAMNLVARPIDNVYYAAGIYPGGGRQGLTWDGLNGKGEMVAVGVYYFRVDLPSGESRWGKLAVIP